jgi:hypothetical protein
VLIIFHVDKLDGNELTFQMISQEQLYLGTILVDLYATVGCFLGDLSREQANIFLIRNLFLSPLISFACPIKVSGTSLSSNALCTRINAFSCLRIYIYIIIIIFCTYFLEFEVILR